jgi:hypothetical protein
MTLAPLEVIELLNIANVMKAVVLNEDPTQYQTLEAQLAYAENILRKMIGNAQVQP